MSEHIIQIDDMSCSHCVSGVAKALNAIAGLKVLSVAIGSAWVEGDDAAVAMGVAALDRIGFPSRVEPGLSPRPLEPRTPRSD